MKRAVVTLALLCAAMSGTAVAGATVGGPTVCEVLSWDARAKMVVNEHESDVRRVNRSPSGR